MGEVVLNEFIKQVRGPFVYVLFKCQDKYAWVSMRNMMVIFPMFYDISFKPFYFIGFEYYY